MTELKIPEVIQRERRRMNVTQEELAQSLGVSPQAVSNWERGGYPDITLLPRIANFFGISVDTLIGNDEVSRAEDIADFEKRFWSAGKTKERWAQDLTLAKEYYAKYPRSEEILHALGEAIVNNMADIGENRALLTEVHGKIMENCTREQFRRDSIHRMCYAASDEELEKRIGESELDWAQAIPIGELREERYLLHGRTEEYRRQRNATDLLIFMQYLGRSNMSYYGSGRENGTVFTEPERTAAWELHKMRLLENFDPDCREENGVPEAWCGCYAEFSLKAAGALIGCGRTDEGFAQLEQTFPLYERWIRIPRGAKMDAGCPDVFGGAQISKWDENCCVYIHFPDGKKIWSPYLWLFWQNPNDIACALTRENPPGWPWFDAVRDDPRYRAAQEKAARMAELMKRDK